MSAPSHRLRAVASIATTILCVQSRSIVAQSPAEVQVRAVVDSFFAAGAAEKWDAAAKLLDMDAFDKVLEQARGNARVNGPTHFITVEELMARDSLPRVVAEWRVAQFAKYPHDPFESITREFARVSTPRELMTLARDEAAARWLEAQDIRHQTRLNWAQGGCKEDIPARLAIPERHPILGIAIGNDSTAYVIHTLAAGVGGYDLFLSDGPPSIIVLARRGRTWRINPNFSRRQAGFYMPPPCGK